MDKGQYQKLGASSLPISPIIIGCMTLNWCIDEDYFMEILQKYYDNGLRTFKTVDYYSSSVSEILFGKFIKRLNIPRERIFIQFLGAMDYGAPKFNAHNMESDKYLETNYVISKGSSRKHILDAVEHSVKELGDLYRFHIWKVATNYETKQTEMTSIQLICGLLNLALYWVTSKVGGKNFS